MSPTARSLRYLRECGHVADVVERWIPRANVRRDLFGVIDVSSTPAATSVIAASVVSGSISETAATAVVLPTPKPPATTIFTGSGGRSAGRSSVGVP